MKKNFFEKIRNSNSCDFFNFSKFSKISEFEIIFENCNFTWLRIMGMMEDYEITKFWNCKFFKNFKLLIFIDNGHFQFKISTPYHYIHHWKKTRCSEHTTSNFRCPSACLVPLSSALSRRLFDILGAPNQRCLTGFLVAEGEEEEEALDDFEGIWIGRWLDFFQKFGNFETHQIFRNFKKS